jgi:hypothetical protein
MPRYDQLPEPAGDSNDAWDDGEHEDAQEAPESFEESLEDWADQAHTLIKIGVVVLFFLACAWGGFNAWWHSPITTRPGILAPDPPKQTMLTPRETITFKNAQLEKVARFEFTGRVLHTQEYWPLLDYGANFAPIDIGVGWGRMSDQQVVEKFSFSQTNRFLLWEASSYPIPIPEVIRSATNMHMIPANSQIERDMKSVRPGELIRVSGYLVYLQAGNYRWNSSLRRDDSGNGACEVVFVETFENLHSGNS